MARASKLHIKATSSAAEWAAGCAVVPLIIFFEAPRLRLRLFLFAIIPPRNKPLIYPSSKSSGQASSDPESADDESGRSAPAASLALIVLIRGAVASASDVAA